MDVENPCDNCGKRSGTQTCEVCGSIVCGLCKLENGCKACNGGEKTF